MNQLSKELQELLAHNKVEQMISTLLNSLSDCEAYLRRPNPEISALKNQAIILSARFNEISSRESNGTIDIGYAETQKNQIISSFLDIINNFNKYPDFLYFLNEREEEIAWQNASMTNSIEAYQKYFSKYPNGKYREETQRIIRELEMVVNKRDLELKQRAEKEKTRRAQAEARDLQPPNFSQAPPAQTQSPPPPQYGSGSSQAQEPDRHPPSPVRKKDYGTVIFRHLLLFATGHYYVDKTHPRKNLYLFFLALAAVILMLAASNVDPFDEEDFGLPLFIIALFIAYGVGLIDVLIAAQAYNRRIKNPPSNR